MAWVTLEEANTYFSTSIDRDSWNNSVDDTLKQNCLDTAFRKLNTLYVVRRTE